jgi:hypothetical protein
MARLRRQLFEPFVEILGQNNGHLAHLDHFQIALPDRVVERGIADAEEVASLLHPVRQLWGVSGFEISGFGFSGGAGGCGFASEIG